jgi:hypothetical protein
MQEGDGFNAARARARTRGLARLVTAALLVGIAAVPMPVLAMGRRPGGILFCRYRL